MRSLLTSLCLAAFLFQSTSAYELTRKHKRTLFSLGASSDAKPACDVSGYLLDVPGQGDVDPVSGEVLNWLALGLGAVQYTCKDDGTWSPTGSRGSLYDASCTYSATSSEFLALTTNVLKLLPGKTQSIIGAALGKLVGTAMPTLGTFYLHEDAQKFDFRKRRGGPLSNSGDGGYVVTKLAAEQAAPVSSYDVPWEKMVHSGLGTLAHSVFRVSTSGGMPNSPSCSKGETTSVPFAAQFWFYSASEGSRVLKGEVLDTASATASKHCDIDPPRKEKERELAVLVNAVIYGDSREDCRTVDECSAKCLADEKCEGFILSTEDSIGHTKAGVTSNEMIYSPVFNSGVVRAINGTQYIDRFGAVLSCPDGQISSASGTGCVAPICK